MVNPIVSLPGLPPIYSVEEIRTTPMPARKWIWKPFLPVGLALIVGKKRSKKSFFAAAAADAIGKGVEFLGQKTLAAKVLIIHTELDMTSTHERASLMGQQSEQVHACYEWSSGDKAIDDLDMVMTTCGYKVIVIDMLTGIAPDGLDGPGYITPSRYWNRLRRLAQRHGAAIVGLWHATKSARKDHLDEVLTSTGLVGQCDSILTLRRVTDSQAALLSTGNHSRDCAMLLGFDSGKWAVEKNLAEGEVIRARSAAPNRYLSCVLKHPMGLTSIAVAAFVAEGTATRHQQDATRKALDRLVEAGKLRVQKDSKEGKVYLPPDGPVID